MSGLFSGVVNFNAYFGCQKCTVRGTYFNMYHVMSFPKIDFPRRTDENFRLKAQKEHHVITSIIEEIPEIDMISDFPTSDSLHLLDLGITKRCLTRWKYGTKSYRFFFRENEILNINSKLLQANENKPSEIHRSIRTFDYLNNWKGSEYRTFLLYIGIVVLKNHLPNEEYKHFLLLSCSTILCSSNCYRSHVFAKSGSKSLVGVLLENYIEGYINIYGEHAVSSNVHNLCHIVEDVQRFGELNSFDAYPFENTLGLIKQKLKTGNKPLEQIARRIFEINSVLTNESVVHSSITITAPELQFSTTVNKMKVYRTVKFMPFRLSVRKFGDKWFQLNDGRLLEFCYATNNRGEINIFGYEINDLNDFFSEPFSSSNIYIYISNGSRGKQIRCKYEEIRCKQFCLLYENQYVFQPLLHTLK